MSSTQRDCYQTVVSDITRGEWQNNVFLVSGLPGTGKSFLQITIHLFLAVNPEHRYVCLAPTNMIAVQQHGITVHKAVKMICFKLIKGLRKRDCHKIEDILISILKEYLGLTENVRLREVSLRELETHLLTLTCPEDYSSPGEWLAELQRDLPRRMTVIIDEGSMVSSIMFVLLKIAYPEGKFIIMYGPNQLPPVSGLPSCDEVLSKQKEGIPIYRHNLETQQRFDPTCVVFKDFVEYFNQVLSNEDDMDQRLLCKAEYFLKNLKIGGTLAEYFQLCQGPGACEGLLVVSTNAQRRAENERRLATLCDQFPIVEIPAIVGEGLKEKAEEYFHSFDVAKVLRIKKGVQCVVKHNDLFNGWIKGSVVTVQDIIMKSGTPVVDYILVKTKDLQIKQLYRWDFEANDLDFLYYISGLSRNKKNVQRNIIPERKIFERNNDVEMNELSEFWDAPLVAPSELNDENDLTMTIEEELGVPKENMNVDVKTDQCGPNNDLCIRQFPLDLFYSATAHSTQGKTLDCKIGVNLIQHPNQQDKNFMKSFLVALSRVRHPEQLYMDKHPVYFLNPVMNLESLEDVNKMKNTLYAASSDPKNSTVSREMNETIWSQFSNTALMKYTSQLPSADFFNVFQLLDTLEKNDTLERNDNI